MTTRDIATSTQPKFDEYVKLCVTKFVNLLRQICAA